MVVRELSMLPDETLFLLFTFLAKFWARLTSRSASDWNDQAEQKLIGLGLGALDAAHHSQAFYMGTMIVEAAQQIGYNVLDAGTDHATKISEAYASKGPPAAFTAGLAARKALVDQLRRASARRQAQQAAALRQQSASRQPVSRQPVGTGVLPVNGQLLEVFARSTDAEARAGKAWLAARVLASDHRTATFVARVEGRRRHQLNLGDELIIATTSHAGAEGVAELLAPGRLLWRHMALSCMSDAQKALEQEARAYDESDDEMEDYQHEDEWRAASALAWRVAEDHELTGLVHKRDAWLERRLCWGDCTLSESELKDVTLGPSTLTLKSYITNVHGVSFKPILALPDEGGEEEEGEEEGAEESEAGAEEGDDSCRDGDDDSQFSEGGSSNHDAGSDAGSELSHSGERERKRKRKRKPGGDSPSPSSSPSPSPATLFLTVGSSAHDMYCAGIGYAVPPSFS